MSAKSTYFISKAKGDLYLDGNDDESRAYNYLGSSHGGILNIGKGRGDQCIANMRAGAVAGFKSFRFSGAETTVSVEPRGAENGRFIVLDAEGMVAAVPVNGTGELKIAPGVHPLFFVYEGKGKVDFISFTIHGGS